MLWTWILASAWAEEPPTLVLAKGADQARFGIGLQLGEPAGVNWKLQMDRRNALQGHFAWSLFNRLGVGLDYLFTVAVLDVKSDDVDLPVYLGVRGVVLLDNRVWTPWFGAGVPVGFAVRATRAPIDGFLELAPIVFLLPETAFGMEGAIGIRGWFGSRSRT